MTSRVFATINSHAEAAVHYFSPAYTATIVDRNPCGTTERVADDIVNCHVGTELRTVVDIAGFTEWRVGSRHIVMVSAKHYRATDFAAQDALENGTCAGNDFLGWLHLPSTTTPELVADIKAAAQTLRENCDTIVVAGIGGSYLGARAVIETLSNSFEWLSNKGENPVILFAGNNIGEDYLYELTEYLKASSRGARLPKMHRLAGKAHNHTGKA